MNKLIISLAALALAGASHGAVYDIAGGQKLAKPVTSYQEGQRHRAEIQRLNAERAAIEREIELTRLRTRQLELERRNLQEREERGRKNKQ